LIRVVTVQILKVVETVDTDESWFTQGLEIHGHEGRNVVYQSTGMYGQSKLLAWDLDSRRILTDVSLPPASFGEGLTIVKDRLIQLTWQTTDALVYNLHALSAGPTGKLTHPMRDGWGLAYHSGRDVVAGTDGSSTLYIMSPEDLSLIKSIEVTDDGVPISRLNEIEWFGDRLLANIWFQPCVAEIDVDTGHVTSWLDMRNVEAEERQRVRQRAAPGMDVLNGVAYRPTVQELWVTGKYWGRLYRVEAVRESDDAATVAEARRACRSASVS
jgi:glutaminyl-peptide cyclotransferase